MVAPATSKSFADRLVGAFGAWAFRHMDLMFRIARRYSVTPVVTPDEKGEGHEATRLAASY